MPLTDEQILTIARAEITDAEVLDSIHRGDDLIDFAHAIEDAAGNWQSMDSAPKDGRPILVSNDERGGSWIAYYLPVFQSGYRPSNPWSSLMLNHEWHRNRAGSLVPTRWMPIPAPPRETT